MTVNGNRACDRVIYPEIWQTTMEVKCGRKGVLVLESLHSIYGHLGQPLNHFTGWEPLKYFFDLQLPGL